MSKLVDIIKPVLLIGEGRDEENFFSSLVEHLGLIERIQVAEYGGKDGLRGFLSALRAFPNLKNIGIMRDADNDHAAALASVMSAISHAKLPDIVRVTPFILPAPNGYGALEALVLKAVSATPTWACVDAFSKCVTEKIPGAFSKTGYDKHRLQAWLSTLPRPGLRLGEAACAGHIPFVHPAFQPITEFILSLCHQPSTGAHHV
jgi:hypothetical protein